VTPRSKPASCIGCACYSHGTDFSGIEGTGSNGVMFVAEASGEHEQRDQLPLRPFAPAGGVFQRSLSRMGLSREQFSITNVVRCRPRNNFLEKAPWEYSAIASCRPNLQTAIAERKPRCIVALGGVALRELTGMSGEKQGITYMTGYVLPDQISGGAIPVIGNLHPSFLRQGGIALFGQFSRVIRRAVAIAAGKDRAWQWNVDPDEVSTHGGLRYITRPTYEDARRLLRRIRERPEAVVVYDLETTESASLDEDAREGYSSTDIRLVQFSIEAGTGIAFPWDGEFREIARDILHTPNMKAGHNVWNFDNKVLRACGQREGIDLIPRGVVHDTLAMFHHWQPDLPAHLQFCAQYVQFPFPWKHLGGQNLAWYGCADVDATFRLFEFLVPAMKREGIWDDENVVAA
jgi:uracil-DNA glycosylase family 4